MSYRELSRGEPKARKQHQCVWCGEAILVGERHEHVTSTYYGDFQDHRFHRECVGPCQEVCGENEGEFEPYDNQRGSVESKT